MPEKLIKFLIIVPLVCLALLPPIRLAVPIQINSQFWFWLMLVGGFLGFFYIYTETNLLVKLIVIYAFINCFFSSAPYLSFNAYISVIIVAYFYALCLKLKDYSSILKVIQAIFFLNVLLMIMQLLGKDNLLNFNIDKPVVFGIIGNSMRWSSYIIILTPFALLSNKLNFIPAVIMNIVAKSSGGILSLGVGLITYIFLSFKKRYFFIVIIICALVFFFAYKDDAINKFKIARLPIWKRSISLSLQHPFVGWGIGTYRVIVPVLSQDLATGLWDKGREWEYEFTKGDNLAWRQAHNFWVQLAFETGLIGVLLFISTIAILLWRLFKIQKNNIVKAGALILLTNMLVHFPDRMMQSVLIIIAYMAYCQKLTKGETDEKSICK